MSNIMTELAEAVFRQLGKGHDDPYQISKAHIFAVQANGDIRTLLQAPDIYDALDEVGKHHLAQGDLALGCETTGWASPIKGDDDEEIAPSQHPERRRVRLVALVSRKFEMASALGFADDDEVITDDGQAVGTLADAIREAMRQMVVATN